jgi:hypothetical protein
MTGSERLTCYSVCVLSAFLQLLTLSTMDGLLTNLFTLPYANLHRSLPGSGSRELDRSVFPRPSSRRITWIGPARIDTQLAHDNVTRHVFPLLADRLQLSARHPAPLR